MNNSFKQALSNYFIQGLKICLSLISLPIYLKSFGEELFGIYLLSFGLATSLTLFDFGISNSMIKYSSEFKGNNDFLKFQKAINFGFTTNLISTFLICLIVSIIGFFSNHLFEIPKFLIKENAFLFFAAIFFSFLYFHSLFPTSIIQGFGQFHSRNKLQLISIAITGLILISLFFFNISIYLFSIFTIINAFLALIFDYYILYKIGLFRNFQINIVRGKQFNEYRAFLNNSKNLTYLSFVSFFSQQADKFILASVLDFKSVTIYTIITKPYFTLKSFFANINSVFQSKIIMVNARDEIENVKNLIVDFTKFSIIITISFFVWAHLFFEYFLDMWLKTSKYNIYIYWGEIAIFNIVLSSFYGPIFRYFYFTSYSNLILKYDSIASTLNFISSILLSYFYGFQGVIIGTTIQFIYILFALNYESSNILNINVFKIFKPFSIIILICYITLGILIENFNFQIGLIFYYRLLYITLITIITFYIFFKQEGLFKYIKLK